MKKHFELELLSKLHEHIAQDKNKLKFYAAFKSSFKFEPYQDILADFR